MQRGSGGTGGQQAANPHCLPHGECVLYSSDARVRAYRPLAPCIFGFEVKPLEIWVELKGRLKSKATHEVFFTQRCCVRREQRLLPFQQGTEPSRGSCNQSNPYHDGASWRDSPAWCPRPLHPLRAPRSLSHSPSLHPWHPPPVPDSYSRISQ